MEALIVGYAPVGKPAAFAVDIDGQHRRAVPLNIKSKHQAELAGIKYVCQAIVDTDIDLKLKVTVGSIPAIFTKEANGTFKKRKKPNKLVDELRSLSDTFKSFSIEKASPKEVESLKGEAKAACI